MIKPINVIVVPETEDFKLNVSHESIVWINGALGNPKLKEHNVHYLAPYWITDKFRGVNRIYEIISIETNDIDAEERFTTFNLGNSFLIDEVWDKMGQSRRFEYHPLVSFGLAQINQGLLLQLNPASRQARIMNN